MNDRQTETRQPNWKMTESKKKHFITIMEYLKVSTTNRNLINYVRFVNLYPRYVRIVVVLVMLILDFLKQIFLFLS